MAYGQAKGFCPSVLAGGLSDVEWMAEDMGRRRRSDKNLD